MAETPKTDTKKDPAPKRMRVRAIQPGWYGNRRRIPGRPGQEFDLVLNWIPEKLHEKTDSTKGIEKGDVIENTGRYQKMPSWVELVGKEAATPEVAVENELEGTGDDEPASDDESPL